MTHCREAWRLSCAAVLFSLALLGTVPVMAYLIPGLTARSLRCERVADPLGVDVAYPRLSWIPEGRDRGQRQTAYRILVASTPKTLSAGVGDLWDSGKVMSDSTLQIPYAGKPLATAQSAYWAVRLWDRDGMASAWSAPATWTMGVLSDADWAGSRWIGTGGVSAESQETLLLRRDFLVRPGLARAIAFVCGLGQYEMTVNGRKCGDDVLSPGWTKYDRTCLYDTRDITAALHTGPNAVGLLLGNGMYNVHSGGRYAKFNGSFGPLKAIALIRLEYEDGTAESMVSDARWKTATGPITFSSVYGGEDYDGRRVQAGWDQPRFDDGSWRPAACMEGPGGRLRGLSASAPPIRGLLRVLPAKVVQIGQGTAVYDLGQNAAYMPRLSVHGTAGSVIRIVPAELLATDGTVDRRSVGGGDAYWSYTLTGHGNETYVPKFFYHGCRYLQVTCSAPGAGPLPVVDSLSAVVVGSSAEPVGEFSCSETLLNRIYALVRWAQRSNMMSVLTDCPHRERLGWLEESHLNGPALRFNFDADQLFGKIANDMADSQTQEGLVPDIAPEYVRFEGGFRDSPEWGSALLIVPWQQYEFSGDLSILERSYEAMTRYVGYLGSKAHGHILDYGLGDWYDIGPNPPGFAQLTPVALTATAFYYQDVRILSDVAALLHKETDRREYGRLASEIKAAFDARFWDSGSEEYATGSQCANAIPCVMGLAPAPRGAALIQKIVADIHRRGNALSAGDVGYRYLLKALADGGRSDVIFAMIDQDQRPGYAYQLRRGATSLTEAWDARPESSQNHFMLGQIVEWFFEYLAGIRPDPRAPGFKRFTVEPVPVRGLDAASASYRSVRGTIVSEWERKGPRFTLRVVVPPNTSATVRLPASPSAVISQEGTVSRRSIVVKPISHTHGQATFAVPSGEYRFTVDDPP